MRDHRGHFAFLVSPMIMKLCCGPGCEEIALPDRPHCAEHAAEADERVKARRAKAKLGDAAKAGAAFYASPRWRRDREIYLRQHPFCADCADLGADVLAEEVDHIEPHRGDTRLMWDQSNWQPLCKRCHSRKTAREVFGSKACS